MDTSKNTIVVGILMPGDEVPVIDRIWNEEGSVRHLVGRLGDPAALRACYEAGPCGFDWASPAPGSSGDLLWQQLQEDSTPSPRGLHTVSIQPPPGRLSD